jgi:cell division protein YceG involved in septum cleavage
MIRNITTALVLILIMTASAAAWLDHYLGEPMAVPAEGHLLELTKGRSLTWVGNDLAGRGILRYPRIFSMYGRFSGTANSIQAG